MLNDLDPYAVNQCSEAVIELVLYLESEFMPSRVSVTKHIEKQLEKKMDEPKVNLARADKLALRTDVALTNESYITTTCYFINANCEMPPSVLLTLSGKRQTTSLSA